MVAVIENNITAIRDACKKHHVKALYLFGSAVYESEFNSSSDIDFLYEINTEEYKQWSTANYDYIDNLSDLENTLNTLLCRSIDLVSYNDIRNRYFKEEIDRNRQLIYVGQ